jgi:hypothetical protein
MSQRATTELPLDVLPVPLPTTTLADLEGDAPKVEQATANGIHGERRLA